MKRVYYIIMIGVLLGMVTGCASLDDKGEPTLYGNILRWTEDWHSPDDE